MRDAQVSESTYWLLLIDPDHARYKKRLRTHSGAWKVTIEPDPHKATEFFFYNDVDLVLLSHSPDSPCLNLLNFFKSVKPSVPVIILTDCGSEELVLSVFRNGAWDYFKKPFIMKELKVSMESALSATKRNSLRQKSGGIFRGIRYISENFFAQLRLSQIARESAMSLSCFERTFKKETGTTYSKFLNKFRISRAAKMLMEEDRSISEIAYACGFNNPYHFARMFNRIMAVSPRNYRKSVQKAFTTISPYIRAKKDKK